MRPLIKNFANDLLSYHGLLIQTPIFSQNFRSFKFGNFQEFDVISWKNFANHLLSYHVLLIQSPIFSQNFRLFEFGNFQEF